MAISNDMAPRLEQMLAIDPKQLQQVFANLNDSDGLKQAAQQFEAVFLQLVLKNMNSATEAISGDDGMFASSEQRMYQEMYSAQMSQYMAASGQMGLADKMVAQLGSHLNEVQNKFKEVEKTAASPLEGNAFLQPLNRGADFAGE